MIPTRKTQPYRRGPREPGSVLDMILRGRAPFMTNPADQRRQLEHLIALMRQRRGG